MSSWGTGIKQSDEFMDVYDEFFERFKDDAVAIDISIGLILDSCIQNIRILHGCLIEFHDICHIYTHRWFWIFFSV